MDPRRLVLAALLMEVLAFRSRTARAETATSSSQAWDLGGPRDPRGLAMGGAGFAVAGSTGAALGNPAALTVSRSYELELAGAWAIEPGLAHYGGAIADSTTSRTAGGLSAHFTKFDTSGLARSALDVRGSVAYPVGDALTIGVAGRWLRTNDGAGAGAVGGESVARGDVERSRLALDVGLLFQPSPTFRVGVVGKNFLADPSFDLPRLYAAGFGLSFDALSLESTALVNVTTTDDPKWRSSTGLAWSVGERYGVRVGYRFDQAFSTHAIGAGVSVLDRSGALEVGVRRDVAGDYPATFIAVGIRALMGTAMGSESAASW
jgi:hypothetical protein